MQLIIQSPTKSEAFILLFQNLRTFTDSVNMQFTKEGLFIQTMDTSHVSIVELNIPSEWFSTYECTETQSLGIHIDIFSKILATKDKSQILTIEYNNHTDKLDIHFTSCPVDSSIPEQKKGKLSDVKIYNTHFEIPLIDLESEHMQIPVVDYAAEFSLSSVNFANIVSQLKLFGDTMDIECSENNIVLYSTGVENGKMMVEINIDDLTEFSINEGEQLSISFGLTYLHNICAFHKLTKEIDLKICNNYPLCAAYALEDNATLRVYLAPKITDNE